MPTGCRSVYLEGASSVSQIDRLIVARGPYNRPAGDLKRRAKDLRTNKLGHDGRSFRWIVRYYRGRIDLILLSPKVLSIYLCMYVCRDSWQTTARERGFDGRGKLRGNKRFEGSWYCIVR